MVSVRDQTVLAVTVYSILVLPCFTKLCDYGNAFSDEDNRYSYGPVTQRPFTGRLQQGRPSQSSSRLPWCCPLGNPVRMLLRSAKAHLLPNRPLHPLRLRSPPLASPHMCTPWQVAEVLRRLDGSTTSAWRSPERAWAPTSSRSILELGLWHFFYSKKSTVMAGAAAPGVRCPTFCK